LSKAARGIGGITEEHEFRVPVGHPALLRKEPFPSLLGVVQHKGDELHELGFRGVLLCAARSLIGYRSFPRISGEQGKEITSEDDAEQY
jgi:hypothetical protein